MKYRLVALAVLGLGASAVQAQEVVKLGVAAPLTGTQAHLGKDIENGVRLAIEEYNAKGVTLGGTSTRRVKRHPTVRDGVVIGAGAKVIGAVEIGERARVGAGSVVVTNVPANATIIGVPGHIVAFRDDANGAIQRLPDPEWDRLNEIDRKVDGLHRLFEHLESHANGVHEEHHSEAPSAAQEL